MINGSVLFLVLLVVAVGLVWLEHRKPKEPRDYRVVHFTLRLALIFAIGAVVIGVLLVASQLGFIPWEVGVK